MSLFVYPTAKSVYPGLLLCRLLFAVGASAAASMITAILAEISTFRVSGRKLVRTAYRRARSRFSRLLSRRPGTQVTFGGPGGLSISAEDLAHTDPYTPASAVYRDDADSEAEPADKGAATEGTLAANPAPPEPSPWAVEGSSGMGMQPYSEPAGYSPADYGYYDQTDSASVDAHEFADSADDGFFEPVQPGTRNGRGAAMVGVMAGLGACFGAFVLVALPVYLRLNHGMKTTLSVFSSYFIVAGMAMLISVILFFGLHDDRAKKIVYWVTGRIPETERVALGVHTEAEQSLDPGSGTDSLKLSYIELLKQGFSLAFEDVRITLAYAGSFVARSTSVCTVMFIPLLVSAAMARQGGSDCSANRPASELTGSCKRGYILSFSVMGVAQTSSLVTAPLWGYAADRFGRRAALLVSTVIGLLSFTVFGVFGTSAAEAIIYFDKTEKSSKSLAGAPGGAVTVLYLFGALMGVSQIGVVIASMSLCTDTRRAVSGSIAGMYSFCGGMGILILSLVGGKLSDWFAGMPFLLIALFNLVLLGLVGKEVPAVAAVWQRAVPRDGLVSKVKSVLGKVWPGARDGRIRLGDGDRSDADFINYQD